MMRARPTTRLFLATAAATSPSDFQLQMNVFNGKAAGSAESFTDDLPGLQPAGVGAERGGRGSGGKKRG